MVDLTDWLLIYFGVNCLAFLAFAIDKLRAQEGGWRTSEQTLLAITLVGGIGAFAARRLTRHKTRKQPFRAQFQVVAVAHVLAAPLTLPTVWPQVVASIAS